jgi:hypothetical protein
MLNRLEVGLNWRIIKWWLQALGSAMRNIQGKGRDELSLNDKKLYFILMCMCYINDVG